MLISCAETACALLPPAFAAAAAVLLGSVDNARERMKAHRFPVDLPLRDGVCAALSLELGRSASPPCESATALPP